MTDVPDPIDERETALSFLMRLTDGGSIVSTSNLTPFEIATARACGRMFVTDDGLGFVYFPAATRGVE
jgi:hypothetical protein